MTILEQLNALTPDQQRQVYHYLWFELTLAVRGLWMDETLSGPQKGEGMKWINEIQHRVWHAHAASPGCDAAWLLGRIRHHVQQAGHIRPGVSLALQRALDRVVAPAAPPPR